MISLLTACGFSVASQSGGDAGRDAAEIDAPLPDAGPCVSASRSCASETVLRSCAAAGVAVEDRTCAWGCIDDGTPDCGTLQPAAGVVTAADFDTSGLDDVTLATTVIDTDDGSISGKRSSGTGTQNGIDFETRSNVAVFRVKSLQITGPVSLAGNRPIVIISDGAITINAVIDGRGDPICGSAGQNAGPGGRDGGAPRTTAQGPGGGEGTTSSASGGGGGGHGAAGGNGGSGANGGPMFGTAAITMLQGGGGGGGGGSGNNSGTGGGGGAAIQLVSNTGITISASGGINAGGCGGDEGTGGNDGGGGGGAGGMILLEAPTISIGGALAVNGGGGGTHDGFGAHATLDRMPAAGGNGPAITDTSGGSGGAGATLAGQAPLLGTFGGGGGAVGRMRFHTRAGSVNLLGSSVLSPSLTDAPTTTTEARATVQ